ncbi:MAG: family 43 glycosylhydrolase [Clostridia bacterium]|jgi:GH43 family beta-xylosidase
MQKKNTFKNPFMMNAPDPYMLIHDGYYYLTATTGVNITIHRSRTLKGFSHPESRVIWTPEENRENSKAIWAPEIHRIGGRWYIYYTATDGKPENRRTFVLENISDDLFYGKWVERGKIFAQPDRWAIDGTVMWDGLSHYFVWSGWEGYVDEAQNLYIAKMKSPYELEGQRVLLSVPEYEWECQTIPGKDYPTVNEGPVALYTKNYIHIVYSGSHFTSDSYCLGILTLKRGADPLKRENWVKSEKPIFEKSYRHGVYSPGHNSFIKSPDGSEDWMIYHAFISPPPFEGSKRCAMAQAFIFDENEMPILAEPLKVGQEIQAPSGEECWSHESGDSNE